MSTPKEIDSRRGAIAWRPARRWVLVAIVAMVLVFVAWGSTWQVMRQGRFLIDGVEVTATIVGEITCSSAEGGGTCTADVQYTTADDLTITRHIALPPHVEVGDTILIRHLRLSPEEATAMASHLQTVGFIVNAALLIGAVTGGVLLVRFLRRHPVGHVFDKPG